MCHLRGEDCLDLTERWMVHPNESMAGLRRLKAQLCQ